MIGIESGLLMFPINILIVAIFRYTKPRLRLHKQKDSNTCDLKDAAVAMSTVVKVSLFEFFQSSQLSLQLFGYNLITLKAVQLYINLCWWLEC